MKKILPLFLITVFIMQSCDPLFVTKPEWALKKPFIADVKLMVSQEFADREGVEPCCELSNKTKEHVAINERFIGKDCLYDQLNKEERTLIFNKIASYIRKKKKVKSVYPGLHNQRIPFSKKYFEEIDENGLKGLQTISEISVKGEEIDLGYRTLKSDTLYYTDTLLMVDPVTLEEKYFFENKKDHISNFNGLKFYESWNLDQNLIFFKKIKYLGLTIPVYADYPDHLKGQYVADIMLLGLQATNWKGKTDLIKQNIRTDVLFDFNNDNKQKFENQNGFDVILTHLLKGVSDGKLNAYDFESTQLYDGTCTPDACKSQFDEDKLTPLSADDFFNNYARIDTMVVIDPVTLEESHQVIERVMSNRMIIGLTFIEDWSINDDLCFDKTVKYVGFIEAVNNDGGDIVGKRVRALIQLPPGFKQ